jgi:hypothetical protein
MPTPSADLATRELHAWTQLAEHAANCSNYPWLMGAARELLAARRAIQEAGYVPALVSKTALAELAFVRDEHPTVWACMDVDTGPALKPFRLLTRDLLALLPEKGTY